MAKIVIAEDEPDIRELVAFTLRFAGHEVITGSNGEEGYLLAKKERPDLVMLDVRMPKLTGYEACKRIKAEPELAAIPVIFLSAKGQDSEIEQGLAAGADADEGDADAAGDDAAQRVAHARACMHVDDHRLAEALGDTVGNADDTRLLQGHHVVEIFGEVLQKGLFRRAGVADDSRKAEFAKQIEGDVLDGAHARLSRSVDGEIVAWRAVAGISNRGYSGPDMRTERPTRVGALRQSAGRQGVAPYCSRMLPAVSSVTATSTLLRIALAAQLPAESRVRLFTPL